MTGRAVALIGDPVSHSVSPAMQAAAFRHAGLDLTYEALTVTPDDLANVFPVLRDRFLGLNVTIPLKERVIPLLDEVSAEAERAGSVNTIVCGSETTGHSTDGAGSMAALHRAGVADVGRALILGTGGAARAVAAALVDEGTTVTVYGRNREAGRRMADTLGLAFAHDPSELPSLLADADLLVNATPVGTRADDSPVPSGLIASGMVVFDLVYRPHETPLLRQAKAAGALPIYGIDMLIEQGARSFELWTGTDAPVEVMREAAHGALEAEVVSVTALEAG